MDVVNESFPRERFEMEGMEKVPLTRSRAPMKRFASEGATGVPMRVRLRSKEDEDTHLDNLKG